MTGIIPFQIPNLHGGQVINQEGFGDTLSSSLAGVLKAMQDREKLEQEKAEFESKQAYFKTLREGNELENEKRRGDLKKEQRALEAKGLGLDAFNEYIGSGGNDKAFAKIAARIKDPDVMEDFHARIQGHNKTLSDLAAAQKAQIEADVARQTQDEAVAGAEADLTKKQSDARVATQTEGDQIAGAKADRQYKQALTKKALAEAEAEANPAADTGRINAARQLWATGGITRKDAWNAVGLQLPAGLDPAEKAPGPGGLGATIDKRRGEIVTRNITWANEAINTLEANGVRRSPYSGFVEGKKIGNLTLSAAEQQLIQSGNMFGQMYSLFVTGQAASDPLLRQIYSTMIAASGDKEAVLQQKALARRLFITAMQSTYGEGKAPSETLSTAIENGRLLGLATDQLKLLERAYMDAHNAESKQAVAPPQSTTVVAPGADWQPEDYDSVMGSYDFGSQR